MNDTMLKLDAEISAQEHLLLGLRRAREILATAVAPTQPPASATEPPLMIEGPRRPAVRGRARRKVEQVFEINDVNVECTGPEFEMLKALFAGDGEWVPLRKLADIAGSPFKAKKLIGTLRTLVKPARARIDGQRGSGFRIVTDD